ncbi:MAG: VWA domain-containing protein [Myxococcota bacterium]
MSYRFADPGWLLLFVPFVLGGLWVFLRRERPALGISGLPLLDELRPTLWSRGRFLPGLLFAAGCSLVCFAMARPQRLSKPAARTVEAIDVIVALDVSTSMRAADFQPRDRLNVAKQSVADFVAQRSEDRIGLLVFAGEATSWTPLTLDYALVLELLEEVEAGMLPDGTAIGTAIGTALLHLEDSQAETKAIVLITDGDSTLGNITPRRAAELAAEAEVKIYTIAIGRGGYVPFPQGKDLFGNVRYAKTLIKVDRALLKDIADTTGGGAFEAKDGQQLDSGLAEILDSLDRTRLESGLQDAAWDDLFPLFLRLAFGLFVLSALLRATRLGGYP